MSSQTPAGWYPAPDASDLLRYWDGEMWTERARPAPTGRAGPSGGLTGNPTVSVQKSELVRSTLKPGERIEAGFRTFSIRPVFFVATADRVIVIKPHGFFGRDHMVHPFDYDQIETIGHSESSGLTMIAGGKTFKGSSMTTAHVEDFTTYVRHRIPRSNPVELSSLPAPAPSGEGTDSGWESEREDQDHGPVSLADELTKLAALHSAGHLSDEEFTAAKARLIAEG